MNLSYLKNIGLHILLGVFMYSFRSFGSVFLLLIIVFFLIKAFNSLPNERPLILLYGCAYITSVEVLLRMSGGVVFYEASKYTVILFSLLGILYRNVNAKSFSYLFYLLLLIPGIYVTLYEVDFGLNIRKAIAFNLSGPFCLGIAAFFLYDLEINKKQMLSLLNHLLYPLISIVTYLFVFNPNVSAVISGTGSNFASSGGFGPNQVATVLGLGMFVSTVKYFYFCTTRVSKLISLTILSLFSFRAIVTFSRGGVFTSIIMILAFLFILFIYSNKKERNKISFSVVGFLLMGTIIWGVSNYQTNGFIEKRYANENARGIKKKDITTGRSNLFMHEVTEFVEHPFLGIGVGRVKQVRFNRTGLQAASHNEMSRILAEHGSLGVLAFSILLLMPLFLFIRNKSNIFLFPFYIFWLLTINHSSMRIAAPAFIYALSLLNYVNEKPTLHREQAIE